MNKLIIPTIVFSLFLWGCQSPKGDFGEPFTQAEETPIKDLLKNPADFDGKTVKVSGEITEICPSGGWFYLKNEGALVFVNLHPRNFAIPQAVGSTAIAEGSVKKEGINIEIVGTGVRLP